MTTVVDVTYVGEVTQFGPAVLIRGDGDERPLRVEAPGGRAYSWGEPGPEARELARAILIDTTGNEMLAERLCRPFTWEVVSQLPPTRFRLGREEVLAWIQGSSSGR